MTDRTPQERRVWGLCLSLVLLPGSAVAHTAGEGGGVPLDGALSALVLCIAAAWYAAGQIRLRKRRRIGRGARRLDRGMFAAGLVLLGIALVWPLDPWAAESFAAHMAQHMLLVTLAAPILIAARPAPAFLAPVGRGAEVALLRALARAFGLRRPRRPLLVATAVQLVVVSGWHLPAAYELALASDAVHILEHLTLLGSALYFWYALAHASVTADGKIAATGACLVTLIHSGMLGGLITFAARPLYAHYAHLNGAASALADQQLAGLIMWVPACLIYLAAGLWLLNAVIRQTGRDEAGEGAGRLT